MQPRRTTAVVTQAHPSTLLVDGPYTRDDAERIRVEKLALDPEQRIWVEPYKADWPRLANPGGN